MCQIIPPKEEEVIFISFSAKSFKYNYIGKIKIIKIMKKIILMSTLFLLISLSMNAQKFALIDMEYILKNIPAYEMTNEQLNQVSQKWQNEVEAIQQEAQNMYKTYQSELVFLSPEMKNKREEEIVKKEQAAQELKRKYFGPEGELYKKRESLMKPIQDEIYTVVKEIAENNNYQVVLDRASAASIIFASPKIDISNEVLRKLGYSK
jgi:outer membrane protein